MAPRKKPAAPEAPAPALPDPPPSAGGKTRRGSVRPLGRHWFRRVMTDEQLLGRRIAYEPPGPLCRTCRHLGDPVPVTHRRGARRWRRSCPIHPSGHTDVDSIACPGYEAREEAQQ